MFIFITGVFCFGIGLFCGVRLNMYINNQLCDIINEEEQK